MKAFKPTVQPEPSFIGIDYHKRYSVFCVVDGAGKILQRGRIDHLFPGEFAALVLRFPKCRVVFEASMNWHWLFELLEQVLPAHDIVLANPLKTRVIAEAQVKTDKVDAHILAQLLRADLVCTVHIPAKETRQRKEVLRQRCFFVRQRTRLRNRVHRLLGGQHGLKLPQCSDLFGKKGMGFLEKLELPAPAGLLLKQQLDMLKTLQVRIKEDETALALMVSPSGDYERVLSLPGMGPILAAVVINEIDGIGRFHTAQKLCGYAGLCPSTSSSGGKTYQGKLMRHCNKWLRWGFIEASWVAIGCSSYFGDIYKSKRAMGKKANTAILAVARRMARITWQLLTQKRVYENVAPAPKLRSQPAPVTKVTAGSHEETPDSASAQGKQSEAQRNFPSRSKHQLVGR
jgi:transposase